MKQHEAVIRVMEENGGYATLEQLYQRVLKVPGCEWKTKTPFPSIRRIVQIRPEFFKIKPGLWALESQKQKVLKNFSIEEGSPKEKIEEFNHAYFQGLLVKIGNIKGFETYVPRQDKNKMFLDKKLGEVSTLDKIYDFTYERVVKRARNIDVTWFNERNFPDAFFEVEHSTDFQNSLAKFVELQDFNTRFAVIADQVRFSEFQDKLSMSSYSAVKKRVKFWSYEKLSQFHARSLELHEIQTQLNA